MLLVGGVWSDEIGMQGGEGAKAGVYAGRFSVLEDKLVSCFKLLKNMVRSGS